MLRSTAVAGFSTWVLGTDKSPGAQRGSAYSPNESLQTAVIGIGGRGGANLGGVAREKDATIVALCDVDDSRAGKAYEKHRQAKKFYDYRKMFDSLHSDIDAVVVSTPDHTHFHPSMTALKLGKHLYCEKPLAHSVWECRQLTDVARENKLATQLGAQRHANPNMHRVVELVRAGAIGVVEECHAWVGGNRGMPPIPKDKPPIPAHLRWDLWLGPAADRDYHNAYCPYGWRFWWDFGTGETGNWGCHVLDIPFWALGLSHPTRIDASGPEIHAQTTPRWMDTSMKFPARKLTSGQELPELTLHWYHSKDGPPILKEHDLPHFGTGVLFVGSEGMLLCDFGKRILFPEAKFKDFKAPPKTIPDSPGFYREWIQACKGGEPATCHFDYSGPMAETVLLGNVAYRAGGGFDWDAKTLTVTGNDRAAAFIRTPYRKGWEI